MSGAPEPVKRLAARLRAPGGMTIKDALAKAHVRVKDVRAHHTDMLAEKVTATVSAIASNSSFEKIVERVADLRTLAQHVEARELAEAARSLCVLLNHLGPSSDDGRKWIARIDPKGRESVEIHAEGMMLLSQLRTPTSKQDREALVAGLREVTARVVDA